MLARSGELAANLIISLSAGRFGTVPRYYIKCLHDRAIPPAPEELAKILLRIG